MVLAYQQQLATYWLLILTPFVVGAIVAGLRNYRKHKKETDEWLKDDITRDRDR